MGSGTLLFLAVPRPQDLETDFLFEVVLYFKVFIAFMLGLFMQSCLKRWFACMVRRNWARDRESEVFCDSYDGLLLKMVCFENLCVHTSPGRAHELGTRSADVLAGTLIWNRVELAMRVRASALAKAPTCPHVPRSR